MDRELFLGIDIGSVTVKTAVLDDNHSLLVDSYDRIKGDPLETLRFRLETLSSHYRESNIKVAGITGSGGKQIAELLGASFINEILAQSAFAGRFHP